MTPDSEPRGALTALASRHQNDGDGGYAFAREVVRRLRRLDAAEFETIVSELLREVDRRAEHWGIVLEALTDLDEDVVSRRLADLYTARRSYDATWRDAVLSALLRLRTAVPGSAEADVAEALAEDRSHAPFLLGHLAVADPPVYRRLAPAFFVRVASAPGAPTTKLKAIVPAHVHQLLDADPTGDRVDELVKMVGELDRHAASRLAVLVESYIAEPWVVRNRDPTVLEALRKRLRRWSGACEGS